MSGTAEPTPAEQHLGDRLAALIDGELGHESRERVLAHLATCHSCKAEADAQRRVKSVFADTAPPGPSDGLLARLQGLPAGGDDGADGSDSAGPEGPAESGWDFSYLRSESVLTPQRGFRIHEPDRAAASRRAGRRFAFAAAGAFSLAAVAIGGALGSATPSGASASPGGSPGASPLRTAATGVAGVERRGTERRGGDALLTAQGASPNGLNNLNSPYSAASAAPPRLTSYRSSAIAPAGSRSAPLDSAGALPPPLIRSAYPAGYAMTVTPPPMAPAPTPAPEPTPMAATPNR